MSLSLHSCSERGKKMSGIPVNFIQSRQRGWRGKTKKRQRQLPRNKRCVSIQGLHPSEAKYATKLHEGCPNSKTPTNAAFFSLFLEDAPLLSFVASHIPRFFVRPKKKKEREKMGTSRGVDRHFRGPGRQKL